MLQTYAKHRPTGFDPAGAFLPDRQDWLLAPVSQTRDSGCLDQSNFEECLAALGGEGDNVEVHRFGHWGPGWYEIILVRPDTDEAVKAVEIAKSLENYPVLNEDDFSRREWEEYTESWQSWGYKDFIDHIKDEYDLRDALVNWFEDLPADELRELFQSGVTNGEYYTSESSGVTIRFGNFDMSRSELAQAIHTIRRRLNALPFERYYRMLPIFSK